MRKFLSSAVALESAVVTHSSISLEEEMQMVADAAAAIPQIAADLTEIDGVVERSEGLEDLAVIADGIDEASDTEIALINNSAAMAVAGTDVAPSEILGAEVQENTQVAPAPGGEPSPEPAATAVVEVTAVPAAAAVDGAAPAAVIPEASTAEPLPAEIVPEVNAETGLAFENYVGKRIAVESIENIRKVARTIWESIKSFLASVWQKIEAFYHNVVADVPRLKAAIKTLEERVAAESNRKIKDRKVTISSSLTGLSLGGSPVKSETELRTALDNFESTAKKLYGGHSMRVKALADSLARSVASFDPLKADEGLTAMNKAAEGFRKAPDFCTHTVKDGRNSYSVKASDSLLGNIVLEHAVKDTGNGSPVSEAELLQSAGLSIKADVSKVLYPVTTAEMTTLTHSGMAAALKTCQQILDSVEEYSRGRGAKDAKKACDALRAASDKAEASFNKLRDDKESAASSSVAAYRAALNYNKTLAKWASSPMVAFTGVSKTVVRATIVAVQKSLAAYE